MPELDLRQIDALVAEHVMGLDVKFAPRGKDGGLVVYTGDRDWLEPGTPYYVDQDGQAWELPRYSSSIAAAWHGVEALRRRGIYIDVRTYADFYEVMATSHAGKVVAVACDPSLPKALCNVFLLAVGVEVPEDASRGRAEAP